MTIFMSMITCNLLSIYINPRDISNKIHENDEWLDDWDNRFLKYIEKTYEKSARCLGDFADFLKPFSFSHQKVSSLLIRFFFKTPIKNEL